MPKIYDVYLDAMNKGKEKGVLSGDIRTLIAYDMGFSAPIDTLLHKDEEMREIEKFNAQFARLLNNEPVEYIINEATFLQHKLYVDPRVLIPRMETQELVANLSEKILDYYDPRNYLVVADIGTGSGAIALALKAMFPNWIILASDLSPDALEVAKKNFDTYGERVTVLEGRSLEPFIEAKTNLDIIVSNPPYILNKEEVQEPVKAFEPESALYLDTNASVYEDIFRDYQKVKKGSLLMAFEIGYDLKDYLTQLMAKYLRDYEFEFVDDLNGLPRFLFVFCR
ncbi:MAG: peptide chain release factor N(5)-glutamine methyltransferase [Erysipelotrichaceae bacterium]|jgi:release factor glutamine methyltransferase|nr:peptide chain release factor N(5)-glutamine methyltransferase [Erysipelotrichaceae bacterium]